MFQLDAHPSGRHFLQIPGPTNVPDRVLRAIDRPTIDHRGPEFARLTKEILDGLKEVFQTTGPIVTYRGVRHRRVGSGARQHALARRSRADVRDRPLRDAVASDGGEASGLVVDFVPGDWRQRRRPGGGRSASSPRTARTRSRPCCVVHNETSTGVTIAHRRDSPGDRPRRTSGAVHGRHDFVAGVDRLSP